MMDRPNITPSELKQIEWFFRWMEERGISFSTGCPVGGHFDLVAEDLMPFLNEEDQFWSYKSGVDVEQWQAFKDALLNDYPGNVCKEILADGRQCRQRLETTANWTEEVIWPWQATPKNFRPGFHDRCPRHGGPKMEVPPESDGKS